MPTVSGPRSVPNDPSSAPNDPPSALPQSTILDLGFLPQASGSQNSLLEAVVGPDHEQYLPGPAQRSSERLPRDNSWQQEETAETPSSQALSTFEGATSFGTSTEKSWDVLSDASLRLNHGEGVNEEAVEELQKKVNKR